MAIIASLKAAIENHPGYFADIRFTAAEVSRIRELIRNQWLDQIRARFPGQASQFEAISMDRYHEYSGLIEHEKLWSKHSRILPRESVQEIRGFSLFKKLEEALGPFKISDEEHLGWELMYWRLVRPGVHGDIGPLHADKWFWDIGVYPGVVPEGATRAKVWVAVYCEPGSSGLQVVPDSQNANIPWERKTAHGMIKPQLLVDESTLNAKTLPTAPGDAVVFHDELIHGGSRAPCTLTRVSFEFTVMYHS